VSHEATSSAGQAPGPAQLQAGIAAYERGEFLSALRLWRDASEQGDVAADYRIGQLYEKGEGVGASIPDAEVWYKRAATGGHVESQYRLGVIYRFGAGSRGGAAASSDPGSSAIEQMIFPNGTRVAKDPQAAFEWLSKAAEAGKGEAQVVVGDMLSTGEGCDRDLKAAVQWYAAAAQQNLAAAQFALGEVCFHGRGLAEKLDMALHWYRLAVEQNHVRAAVALGLMYLNGKGVERDFVEAARLFAKAAASNDAVALYHIGIAHLKGDGVDKDIDHAETELRKSARLGYLPARVALGEYYARGGSGQVDLRESAHWYEKAAEQGDVNAQFLTGRFYSVGEGVAVSQRDAAKWFLRAAENGHGAAALSIAACFGSGSGVERNIKRAIQWFEVAAKAGIRAAQVQLGRFFASGTGGVERDLVQAEHWFEQAADGGDAEAKVAYALFLLETKKADRSRAIELLTQAAEAKYAPACLQMGHVLAGRMGGMTLMSRAVEWYGRAAETGSVEAMVAAAQAYLDPKSGVTDPQRALGYLERAAATGNAAAQFQLGVMFCTGNGVAKNPERGFACYEAAARQNHAAAQFNLAVMLSKGQGGKPGAQAVEWFRKAADQGLVSAQLAMGDALRSGSGVEKDLSASASWYKKAAEQGNDVARQRLNAMTGRMMDPVVDALVQPPNAEVPIRQKSESPRVWQPAQAGSERPRVSRLASVRAEGQAAVKDRMLNIGTAAGAPFAPLGVRSAPSRTTTQRQEETAGATRKIDVEHSAIGDRALGHRAIRDRAIGHTALGDTAPEHSELGDSALRDRAPGHHAIKDHAPGHTALGETALHDHASEDSVLRDSVLGDSAIGESALHDHASEDSASEDAALAAVLDKAVQKSVMEVGGPKSLPRNNGAQGQAGANSAIQPGPVQPGAVRESKLLDREAGREAHPAGREVLVRQAKLPAMLRRLEKAKIEGQAANNDAGTKAKSAAAKGEVKAQTVSVQAPLPPLPDLRSTAAAANVEPRVARNESLPPPAAATALRPRPQVLPSKLPDATTAAAGVGHLNSPAMEIKTRIGRDGTGQNSKVEEPKARKEAQPPESLIVQAPLRPPVLSPPMPQPEEEQAVPPLPEAADSHEPSGWDAAPGTAMGSAMGDAMGEGTVEEAVASWPLPPALPPSLPDLQEPLVDPNAKRPSRLPGMLRRLGVGRIMGRENRGVTPALTTETPPTVTLPPMLPDMPEDYSTAAPQKAMSGPPPLPPLPSAPPVLPGPPPLDAIRHDSSEHADSGHSRGGHDRLQKPGMETRPEPVAGVRKPPGAKKPGSDAAKALPGSQAGQPTAADTLADAAGDTGDSGAQHGVAADEPDDIPVGTGSVAKALELAQAAVQEAEIERVAEAERERKRKMFAGLKLTVSRAPLKERQARALREKILRKGTGNVRLVRDGAGSGLGQTIGRYVEAYSGTSKQSGQGGQPGEGASITRLAPRRGAGERFAGNLDEVRPSRGDSVGARVKRGGGERNPGRNNLRADGTQTDRLRRLGIEIDSSGLAGSRSAAGPAAPRGPDERHGSTHKAPEMHSLRLALDRAQELALKVTGGSRAGGEIPLAPNPPASPLPPPSPPSSSQSQCSEEDAEAIRLLLQRRHEPRPRKRKRDIGPDGRGPAPRMEPGGEFPKPPNSQQGNGAGMRQPGLVGLPPDPPANITQLSGKERIADSAPGRKGDAEPARPDRKPRVLGGKEMSPEEIDDHAAQLVASIAELSRREQRSRGPGARSSRGKGPDADLEARADRFVERWQELAAERNELARLNNVAAREKIEQDMFSHARGLERDPQLKALLRSRGPRLGLEGVAAAGDRETPGINDEARHDSEARNDRG